MNKCDRREHGILARYDRMDDRTKKKKITCIKLLQYLDSDNRKPGWLLFIRGFFRPFRPLWIIFYSFKGQRNAIVVFCSLLKTTFKER